MSNPAQSDLRITSVAGVLAALPAMIGFTPYNSIVTVLLAADASRKTFVRAVIRSDASDGGAPAAGIAAAASRHGVDAVILVAVADARHTVISLQGVDGIRHHLREVGIDVRCALHTSELTAGAVFRDLDTADGGVVPDPASSEVTVSQVFSGRAIESDRRVVEQRFEEGDEIPESVGLRAAAILGDAFLAATFEELAATVYAREIPSEAIVSRVGITLSGSPLDVRDAYLRLAIYGEQRALEAMTHIARGLRGPARAQALTIAGYFAYLGGDGAAAGIAFDAARRAADSVGIDVPPLTGLLDRALRAGFEPKNMRDLIPSAETVEKSTGATLTG